MCTDGKYIYSSHYTHDENDDGMRRSIFVVACCATAMAMAAQLGVCKSVPYEI